MLLSVGVATALIGVGTEVKAQLAPAFVQDNRPDPFLPAVRKSHGLTPRSACHLWPSRRWGAQQMTPKY